MNWYLNLIFKNEKLRIYKRNESNCVAFVQIPPPPHPQPAPLAEGT